MDVTVYACHQDIDDRKIRDRSLVVIDLLRASTCIVQAVDNGARSVIPVGEVEEAVNIHRARGGQTLLAGERHGLKIDSFDLGNSPQDFLPEIIRRRVIVMCTTNGSAALERLRRFYPVWVGCLRNRKALCEQLVRDGKDIAIVCAGTDGAFSADDIFCAGSFLRALRALTDSVKTDDLGLTAECFYSSVRRNPSQLGKIEHIKTLHRLGLDEDISFCFQEDVSMALPTLYDGFSIEDYREVGERM